MLLSYVFNYTASYIATTVKSGMNPYAILVNEFWLWSLKGGVHLFIVYKVNTSKRCTDFSEVYKGSSLSRTMMISHTKATS